MQAGRLDRKIDIERKALTQDEFGQETEAWDKIASRRAASATPVNGDERFAASQFVGKRVIEFRIRYSAALANVNPLDRIVYPAGAAESPTPEPAEDEIYDIQDVREIGRREGLQIFAVSRSEVAA